MAILRLVGVPPLDGDYDLDVQSFTNRELHTIKQLSGVRAGELQAAMAAGDNDLVVAFAVIVLRRAGKTVDPDQIWDAELTAIQVILDDAPEVAPRPLDSPPPNGPTSSDDEHAKLDAHTESSGSASSDFGEEPQSAPSRIGPLGSVTPADSDPETLAS